MTDTDTRQETGGTEPASPAADDREGETVSQRLVRAREGRGLSQKAVADELFLTTTFIRYIDEGDFHKIPKAAFIKGYLRSYARVVGLDGDDVVAAFEREQNIAPQTPKIIDVTERADPPSGMAGPIIQTGVFGLIALIVVGAAVWWISSEEAPTPTVTQSSPRETAAAADGEEAMAGDPAPGAPALQAVDEAPESVSVPPEDEAPASSDQTAASRETPGGAVAEPMPGAPGTLAVDDAFAPGADVQIERVTEDGINYITVYAGGETQMGFEFNDECWVEIIDGDGVRIYGDLNGQGDVMTVFGQGPFDVLLGRAPAVDMTYEGGPVDVNRFTTRDDTARIRTARL